MRPRLAEHESQSVSSGRTKAETGSARVRRTGEGNDKVEGHEHDALEAVGPAVADEARDEDDRDKEDDRLKVGEEERQGLVDDPAEDDEDRDCARGGQVRRSAVGQERRGLVASEDALIPAAIWMLEPTATPIVSSILPCKIRERNVVSLRLESIKSFLRRTFMAIQTAVTCSAVGAG